MLVSLNWFKEFAIFPDEGTLIHDLNCIGFEVEGVHYKGRNLSKIVVGHIKEFKAHPDADRLRVAQVDIGSDTIQIVTAAENVNEGDKIPVSLHGATLAGGLKIKKGKLRGVESNGMMCSAVECGLTDTSPGVWVLPTDTPVGVDFIEVAGLVDTVLDISILPNRGDALSLLGLARECHALYGESKSFSPKEIAPTQQSNITCEVDPNFCSYYRAQKISGVHNKSTPLQFQTKLYYSGFRPLSWLVDVTNIVMIETGQPMHAFDAANIESIRATLAQGQSVELLNEKTYTLDATIPIIEYNGRIEAVAGVMGARESEVNDATNSIVLETALFDSVVVRKATKTLGVRSESSNRFEKHVDAEGLMIGVARVHELLAMHDDIHVYEPAVKGDLAQQTTTIDIHMDTINQFLGTSYSLDEVKQQLSPLGFEVDGTQVHVPSFRANDCQEWPDIAEEMCRFSGIEEVNPAPMVHMLRVQHHPLWMKRQDFQQRALHLGLTEVVPFPLLENDVDGQPAILNPITPELTALRSNALKSLIDIAAFNATRHPLPCRLFSMGPVWSSNGDEHWHFSALIAGDRHHEPHASAHQRGIDFYYIKGVVEQLLGHEFDVQRSDNSRLHPGQSADILVDGSTIGCFGILHPSIQSKRKLGVCGLIEFNLAAVGVRSKHQYQLISKYPSTTRDVTYIMDHGVSVGDALAILRTNKPTACESIILCGVYQKPGSDEVNVSFRMIYQDNEGSLEMVEVNAIHKTFAEEVVQKLPCRFP